MVDGGSELCVLTMQVAVFAKISQQPVIAVIQAYGSIVAGCYPIALLVVYIEISNLCGLMLLEHVEWLPAERKLKHTITACKPCIAHSVGQA